MFFDRAGRECSSSEGKQDVDAYQSAGYSAAMKWIDGEDTAPSTAGMIVGGQQVSGFAAFGGTERFIAIEVFFHH
jgi:hypothetical protein